MLSHYCSIITSLVSYLELFSFFVMFINSSFIWMIIFIYYCIYTSEFSYLVDENCYAVRLIFIREMLIAIVILAGIFSWWTILCQCWSWFQNSCKPTLDLTTPKSIEMMVLCFAHNSHGFTLLTGYCVSQEAFRWSPWDTKFFTWSYRVSDFIYFFYIRQWRNIDKIFFF